MFDLFIAEADQSLQFGLIAEPVVPAQFQDLGIHIAFQQTEHVGVCAALDLADEAHFLR